VRFEWDDEKAVDNLKKHGVSFGEATEVFYDPNALEEYDDDHSSNEDRFVIIGLSSRRLLVDVYSMLFMPSVWAMLSGSSQLERL